MNKSKAFSLSIRVAAMMGAALALLAQAPPARSATPLALQAAPVVTVPGLAAYWPFNSASGGVSADISGNMNDGTLTSGAAIDAINKAAVPSGNPASVALSGSGGQMVTAFDSPSLSLTGSLTLSAWIRPTLAAGGNQKGIIEKWDYTTAAINGYMMRLNASNYLSFAVCGAANNTGISTAPRAITTNTWTHVACTYDSLTQAMTMYVNGVADPTTGSNVTGAPTNGVSELHIGADYGANNFGGNIDEARIYARSLSQPEVDVLRTMVQPPATFPLIAGGNQVDLSWTAPTNAGSVNVVYSILRGTTPGVYTTVFNNIMTTFYTDIPPATGTYYYAIVAVSVIPSANSTEVSALFTNTPPPPPPPPRTTTVGQNKHHRCGCSTMTPGALPIPFGAAAALVLAIFAGARRRR